MIRARQQRLLLLSEKENCAQTERHALRQESALVGYLSTFRGDLGAHFGDRQCTPAGSGRGGSHRFRPGYRVYDCRATAELAASLQKLRSQETADGQQPSARTTGCDLVARPRCPWYPCIL